MDAGLDHRVALDPQREQIAAAAHHRRVDVEVALDAGVHVAELARGDAAEERDLHGLRRREIVTVEADHPLRELVAGVARLDQQRAPQPRRSQRPGLHADALEVALALERAQVVAHAVRRADVHARADLPERRRIPLVVDGLLDELQDRLLPFGELLRRHRVLLSYADTCVPVQANYLNARAAVNEPSATEWASSRRPC